MKKIIAMKQREYDITSAQSILDYGMRLLGHSLRELHPDAKIFNGKGGLGTSVEYYHYDYEPNSESRPDFPEAGLELKCTPLKLLADKSMGAKERLVLNIINFIEEALTKHLKQVVSGTRINSCFLCFIFMNQV